MMAATDASVVSKPLPAFYYGWVNVGIAAIAMSATFPGRTYGLSLIKEPLRDQLGIGDLRFNVLNFWAIIIGAALVIPVGRLIDRIGSRLTLGIVGGLLGLSVLLMAASQDEWQLALTLTLVRGLGQGALSVVAITLVGKWFRRRAGLAMGVFTVLLGIGFLVPIILVGEAVKQVGWRLAWDYVGWALLLGLVPIGLLLARSTPESMGVEPDEPVEEAVRPAAMTLRQAARTPEFWITTSAACVFNLVFSALTLDNAALLQERNLASGDANALVLGLLMLSGLGANLAAGYFARFRPLRSLLGIGVAVLALSLMIFPFANSLAVAAVYAVLLGIAGGVITVIYFATYGHDYGRANLGSIQSVVQVLTVFASAIGPVLLAFVRENNNGNTSPFFIAFAVVTSFVATAALIVRRSEPLR